MARESCISYPAKSVFVMVRAPLIAICKIPVGDDKTGAPDPQAAAVILHQFIHWTDGKLSTQHQSRYFAAAAESEGESDQQDHSLWIYKDYDELKLDLLDLFGRNKIIENVQWLVSAGYLNRRTNPRYRWDKTLQYAVDVELVQSRIDALPKFEIKLMSVPNQTIEDGKSKRAIPKKTTEKTKKEEKILLPVADATGETTDLSHTHNTVQEADDMSMFPLQGKTLSASAEKVITPAVSPSPLMQKPSTAEDVKAPSPNAAAPLPQGEASKPKGKGKAAPASKNKSGFSQDDQREMATKLGEAFGIPPASKEFGVYIRKALDLVEGGIPTEKFKAYCEWRKKQAGDWANRLIIRQLIREGDISAFLAFDAKKAIPRDSTPPQVSTTPSGSKNGYSRRNDPAYAHLYADPEIGQHAK